MTRAMRFTALVGALGWLGALACGSEKQEPASPAPVTPPAPAAATPGPAAPAPVPPAAGGSAAEREAAQIFATRCATCHGPEGRGDGPGAAGLSPKPRNYHDPGWQSSVTNEHLAAIIVGGGPAVDRSPLMPPNPDLAGKPEVVAALVAHIRSLAKP